MGVEALRLFLYFEIGKCGLQGAGSRLLVITGLGRHFALHVT